jgi:anaerobic nitric oxide reductase flavorubredoxin
MKPIEIRPGVFWVGVNDRVTDLFEGLWPISREGISYNAYLVVDEKSALIDLSKEMLSEDYLAQLAQVFDITTLDYVVINHMEPDHSGALRRVLELAPSAQILGMPKTVGMLNDFYGITENVTRLSNGEELSLGKHTLRFVYTPFVHWPETMMTYMVEEQVSFPATASAGTGYWMTASLTTRLPTWLTMKPKRCATSPTSWQPSVNRCSALSASLPICRSRWSPLRMD